MSSSPFIKTPTVTVLDNRRLIVRTIGYHRHPDTPDVTDELITYNLFDTRGFLNQTADPRLHAAGLANFRYLTDLAGTVLRSQGVDNGTTVSLIDAAGRPFIAISNIYTDSDGSEDRSQAVTHIWQYEEATLLGRPLSITVQPAGGNERITERFVYAGSSDAETTMNLAGQCISHYDTAGLEQIESVSLTGITLSVTRRLLKEADDPDVFADWQGVDASAWNDLLAAEAYTTTATIDTTGAVLTTTDAEGNVQRLAYDVAGMLSGSWLTMNGGTEQVIVKSLSWNAAGQKLSEEHGNGVVTTYEYEPETQHLTGIKTERPTGHPSGAKVLQDLRYEYDPVGNVLHITNDAEETRFWRNQKVVPENTYIYDSLYQLVSATGREMANTGQQDSSLPSTAIPLPTDSSAYTAYTRTYSYDNAGNLTQIRHSAPATNNNYTTDITISNRSNRGVLSTLTTNPSEVDALFTAGGLQKQLLPGQTLTWTPRNELLKVNPVVREGGTDDQENYRYDQSSQRILKVSMQKTGSSMQTQRVLYLPGLELRSTTNGSTETENLQAITMEEAGRAQVRVLHWVAGKPAEISNDHVRYSYDTWAGSGQLVLDSDGEIISMEEYYPYGGTAILAARSQIEVSYKIIRYSGKERDATGLYYHGYRYYMPWAGRWLSADPIGSAGGNNLYTMVGNNPISFVDLDGLIRTYIEDGVIYTSSYSADMNERYAPLRTFDKSNLGRKKIKGKRIGEQTTGAQLIAANKEGDRKWGSIIGATEARTMSISPQNDILSSWGHQIAKRWGGPGELWNASSATNAKGIGAPAQEDFQSILEEAIDGTYDSPAHERYKGPEESKLELSQIRIKHTAYYYDNAGTELSKTKYAGVAGPDNTVIENIPTTAKFMRLKIYVNNVKKVDQTTHENAQRLDKEARKELLQMYIKALTSETSLEMKKGIHPEVVLSNSFSRGEAPGKAPFAMRGSKINYLLTT